MKENKISNLIISEEEANRYLMRCIGIAIFFFVATLIFNKLGIYKVDTELMSRGICWAVFFLAIPFVICRLFGYEKPWIKYVLIFLVVVSASILGSYLTYHIVIYSVFPLIFSALYANKRFTYYTFVLSVVSMSFIVIGGYYWGLCDANMYSLTTKAGSEYIVQGVLQFGEVNLEPWVTLPIFFIFPRCCLLYLTIPVMQKASSIMQSSLIRAQHLQEISEIDSMTGLFNKNKYLSMMEHVYPHASKVGILFFDVNNLKQINDTLGHQYGDYIISKVGMLLKQLVNDKIFVYRVGGDEFVLVAQEMEEEQFLAIIPRWEEMEQEESAKCENNISIAYGYSYGKGQNIEQLIHIADEQMYGNKKKKQENRH